MFMKDTENKIIGSIPEESDTTGVLRLSPPEPLKQLQNNPSFQGLLTQIRKEAAETVNKKFELIVGDTRHALAFFVTDGENFLLLDRSSIPEFEQANNLTDASKLGYIDRVDDPIGSRGVAPDSSFKVPELNASIPKSILFLGDAHESSTQTGAQEDTEKVIMPVYLVTIDEGPLDQAKESNPRKVHLLTAKQVLQLTTDQITTKVQVLIDHLSSTN